MELVLFQYGRPSTARVSPPAESSKVSFHSIYIYWSLQNALPQALWWPKLTFWLLERQATSQSHQICIYLPGWSINLLVTYAPHHLLCSKMVTMQRNSPGCMLFWCCWWGLEYQGTKQMASGDMISVTSRFSHLFLQPDHPLPNEIPSSVHSATTMPAVSSKMKKKRTNKENYLLADIEPVKKLLLSGALWEV